MVSLRKRTWKSGGEINTAWVADYSDQGGKRHIKTFGTKKAADAWLVETRGEVAQGVHTRASAASRRSSRDRSVVSPNSRRSKESAIGTSAACCRSPSWPRTLSKRSPPDASPPN